MKSISNLNLKQNEKGEEGENVRPKSRQEKEEGTATGRPTFVEGDIFKPRNSLSRSPPRCETPVAHGAESEAWEDENLEESPIFSLVGKETGIDNIIQMEKKRKRGTLSPQPCKQLELGFAREEMENVESMLSKVIKRTKELKKLVNESSKTKIEIKQVARELDSLVDKLEERVKQYKQKHLCIGGTQSRDTTNSATQTDTSHSTIGVQADWRDIQDEKQEAEKKTRNLIRGAMQQNRGFEGVADILDIIWPEDVYVRTKVEATSKRRLNEHGDYAIFFDAEGVKDNKSLENLTLLYPGLTDVIRKNEGGIDYIIKKVATLTKSMSTQEASTALYVMPIKIHKGVTNMEEVFSMLTELRNNMQIHVTEKMNIILSDGLDKDYIRKLLEYVFANTSLNISLLVAPTTASNTQKAPAKNSTARPQTEKVIIKNTGSTYADLLKSVKNNVDLNQVGVKVKTIRRTAAGDLMLEVEGDKKKAGALKEAISNRTGNEVRIANNTVTMHVLDIDAATNTDEVENALRTILPGNGHDIIVKSMRPSRDGNQIATVQASRLNANKLTKAGRVKIGWVSCRIRERVVVPRCYRCLEFGHSSKECEGPDRSKLCINCGQEGHKATDCKEVHYCLKCNSKDHRADTTKCPSFRQLLKEQRKTHLINKNAKK